MAKLLILFLLWNVTSQADSLDPRGDSGIYGPKYAEILTDLERLEAENPKFAEIYDYGTSVSGRTLRMLIVAKKDAPRSSRNTVQITGSIHGNEYLSIADRLPEAFLSRAKAERGPIYEFLNDGGVVLFVPIVNPDGYEKRRRTNTNGKDLNRDWDVDISGKKGFTQPETTTLAQALIDQKERLNLDLKVTVDYHCCAGSLLYPWAYTRKSINSGDLSVHLKYAEYSKGLSITYGTVWDILGYLANGTTMDYYYESHGALAYTFEGRYRDEKNYLPQHIQWWERGLSALD